VKTTSQLIAESVLTHGSRVESFEPVPLTRKSKTDPGGCLHCAETKGVLITNSDKYSLTFTMTLTVWLTVIDCQASSSINIIDIGYKLQVLTLERRATIDSSIGWSTVDACALYIVGHLTFTPQYRLALSILLSTFEMARS
jgi:hypothetical protein